MPAYDFRCTTCDHVFEVIRPVGTATPSPCPECGCDTKRVFTPVGVVFKGSGFHNTDYKKRPAEDKPAAASCGEMGSSAACSSCPAASE